MKPTTASSIAFAALACLAANAWAHVSFAQPRAEAGRPFKAVLHVGHGCDNSATTSVALQVPPLLRDAKPVPKTGWNVTLRSGVATWSAQDKAFALPPAERGEFTLAGVAPSKPGSLWLKVRQTCEQGAIDWSEIPVKGNSTAALKNPAVLLEIMSPLDFALAQALPQVEGAWVRATVPGQQGTGAFMRLTARAPMQLVGVATPVAGAGEVHEMKLEGDVMTMRAVSVLDLPVGQPLELKPGGYHIMLQDLKQPLAKDSSVGLTLFFRNAKGAKAQLELKVPVAMQLPGVAGAAPTDGHKH